MYLNRAMLPLISVAVAFAGFLVGLGVIAVTSTPEYEHSYDLRLGFVGLIWSYLALISVVVSATSLLLLWDQQKRWRRWATVALNIAVVLVMAVVLNLAWTSLRDYYGGFVAYDTAVQLCGHPPALASRGLVPQGTYILSDNSDYDRLKYSTQDHLLLGVPRFFCTAAEAEAQGYRSETNP